MTIQKLLKQIFSSVTMVLSRRGITINSHIIDTKEYTKIVTTPAGVYGKINKEYFYNPFNFGHTDFGRLILVSIDDHQEIKTVELVEQHNSKGAFVIVYYHNGNAEIYVNSSIQIDKKYLKPNADWKIVSEQEFEYIFEDTQMGVFFTLDIRIKNGQRIRIKLQQNQENTKRYSFLAPIGADLSDAPRFPFVYLKEAGFVPVEGTEFSFEINEKKMKLTKIPIKVEGEKCFKAPYSFTPLPFFWNEEHDTYLSAEKIGDAKTYQKDNAVYSFIDNNGHKEIERITYNANGHSSSYSFSPSFPDIASLKTGTKIDGNFCLGIDTIGRIICGSYSVINTNGEIIIDFQPKKCWQPMPGKDWVSKYHYHAKVIFTEDKMFKITSKWTVK